MSNTGNMKSIAEIIDVINEKETTIPLLQRNYKWTMECAAQLAEDLWDAFLADNQKVYQLNMITVYKDVNTDELQILDGQQRMITLKLLLTILESQKNSIDFDFERDLMLQEKEQRRYFINHVLSEQLQVKEAGLLSVDVTRLWDNYNAMVIPLSFRTVYDFYGECLEEGNNENKNVDELFINELNSRVVLPRLQKCFGVVDIDMEQSLFFQETEVREILKRCEGFRDLFKIKRISDADEISDDEIKVSPRSEWFQRLWNRKQQNLYAKKGRTRVVEKLNRKEELADYIKNFVEVLYHETTSEPIDEFLNINENKTRFVISDYIRANMISDNPIDGDIREEDKITHQRNRDEVLELFATLSKFLYQEKYSDLWHLINHKGRYGDFEKHPDVNRLKVVFCDKYPGTSTKGYEFSQELNRLRYFKEILGNLAQELGLEDTAQTRENLWNVYNAVYILLECKDKYRFFNIFTQEDIDRHTALSEVTARERFCFFEWAYKMASKSDDVWDISYFLESQLFTDRCDLEKGKNLPHITKQEQDGISTQWCCINRGEEDDELSREIELLMQKIKENR